MCARGFVMVSRRCVKRMPGSPTAMIKRDINNGVRNEARMESCSPNRRDRAGESLKWKLVKKFGRTASISRWDEGKVA